MFAFFDRLESGWEITKDSLRVLREDKELMVFPVLGLLSTLVFHGSIATVLWLSGYGIQFLNQKAWGENPMLWICLLVDYVVCYFLVLYFECAVAACAIIRLRGGDPTVADGLRSANSRLPQLVAWSLVAGTVGLLLKMAERRSERMGSLMASVAGFVWSWATFFIVPVLVIEKVGPLEALRRSGRLIRDYWGEGFVADLGIGLIGFLGMLPAFLMISCGALAISRHQEILGSCIIAAGITLLLVVILMTTTLETIARAGLYAQAASEKKLQRFEKRILGE